MKIKTKIRGESSAILQHRFVTTIRRLDFIKLSATKWGAVISFWWRATRHNGPSALSAQPAVQTQPLNDNPYISHSVPQSREHAHYEYTGHRDKQIIRVFQMCLTALTEYPRIDFWGVPKHSRIIKNSTHSARYSFEKFGTFSLKILYSLWPEDVWA
jgi:hypothetical protein